MRKKEKNFLVALFFLFLFVGKLLFAKVLPLAADETYYWVWSKNLALSYFDHPPLVAYLIALFSFLGDTVLAIRFAAILLGLFILLLFFFLSQSFLKHKGFAFLATLFVAFSPILSLGGTLITPDTALAFFWLIGLFLVLRLIETRNPLWWYGIGVAGGLGLLSKYTFVLFFLGLGFYLWFSGDLRFWLRRKEPYFAILLSLLFFSPVIVWNATHDWISFVFQWGHGFENIARPWWKMAGAYVGGQVGLLNPLLCIFVFLFWCSFPQMLRKKEKVPLWWWCGSLPVFFFFFLSSLKAPVEANWPAAAYLPAILGAVSIIQKQWKKGYVRKLTFGALTVGLGAVLLVHIQLLRLPFEVGARELLRQFYGWKELAGGVDQKVTELEKQCTGRVLVYAKRYQVVSELRFHSTKREHVWNIQDGRDAHQYGIWRRPVPQNDDCVVALLHADDGVEGIPDWLSARCAMHSNEDWKTESFGKTAQHVRAFTFLSCPGLQ